jgi:hypothetical protein
MNWRPTPSKQQLASEAVVRPILTWRSYARELLRQLASHHPRQVPSHCRASGNTS